MEFRFYEIPQGEPALALYGDTWKRVYGHEEFQLHFHNLLEVGVCRYGAGDMYFDREPNRYMDGDFTVIPANFPHLTVSDGEEPNFWEYVYFDLNMIVEALFPHRQAYQTEIVKDIEKTPLLLHRQDCASMYALANEIIAEMREQKPFYQKMTRLRLETFVMELVRCVGGGGRSARERRRRRTWSRSRRRSTTSTRTTPVPSRRASSRGSAT